MVQELRHPEAGSVQGLGNPVKLSRTPARLRKTAPRLGEDTRAVLGEAGYAADEIAALEARGIVRS
jgi:crotonobetainyl-CoA:carnitine CoA-transferase CaiB-like acyl-CoA transferase